MIDSILVTRRGNTLMSRLLPLSYPSYIAIINININFGDQHVKGFMKPLVALPPRVLPNYSWLMDQSNRLVLCEMKLAIPLEQRTEQRTAVKVSYKREEAGRFTMCK